MFYWIGREWGLIFQVILKEMEVSKTCLERGRLILKFTFAKNVLFIGISDEGFFMDCYLCKFVYSPLVLSK